MPYPTDNLAIIQASGPDARDFLHAQFCSDVNALDVGDAGLTGYCNPKGRLLANGVLLRSEAELFLLVLPKERAVAILPRLKMFVLRAKVELTLLDGSGACIANQNLLKDAENTAVVGDTGLMLAFDMAEQPDANACRVTRLRAGVALICNATAEEFLPQSLNLAELGGLSFKKGCYPGQEIVARTHYLGKLKQQLKLLEWSDNGPAEPGSKRGDDVVLESAFVGRDEIVGLLVTRSIS